jgi:hypothetical protein
MFCKHCGKETNNNSDTCDNCLSDKSKLDKLANEQLHKNYSNFLANKNEEYLKLKGSIKDSDISISNYFSSAFLLMIEIIGISIFVGLAILFFVMNFQIIADVLIRIGFDPKKVTYENGRLVEKYYNILKVVIIVMALIDLFITMIIRRLRNEIMNKMKMNRILKGIDKIINELVNFKLN